MTTQEPLTFVISDESINSYGSRILTAGVDLSLFKKNPIMLWNHHRSYRGTNNEILPIGKWDKIRKVGTQILADAVFDIKDDFAQQIKSKVEQGIINMASAGINIIVTSEDSSVLVNGQTRATITKCLLREVSLCDIASNRNAVRLSDNDGNEINLSDNSESALLPLLNTNQILSKMKLTDLSKALNLQGEPNEENLLAAVNAITAENLNLKAENTTYQEAETTRALKERDTILSNAVTARKITESQRPTFEKLYDADPAATTIILNEMAGVEKPTTSTGDAPQAQESALERKTNQVKQNLKQL